MIIEIAHLATVFAFVMAVALGFVGHIGAWTRRLSWVEACATLASAQLIGLLLGFVGLVIAFYQDDFSVRYVANNSNELLPWYYKICAVWGNHEGSLLLSNFIMAIWTYAVALVGRRLPYEVYGRVLGTMGVLNSGFMLFLLATSNPFLRLLPSVPISGADLNPLLQDFGFIVHPPMLYIGYVGFSVTFSFAIAALMSGRLDAAWARWSRPWTNCAWAFLTVGITLGSWWAYYELGWGGWWFWDPVENASFMPWLAGTALIHSLAVTEKRGAFKSWTVLLAILTYTLCVLGVFIVRSGILVSVHAFAVDPDRGLFVLVLLILVVAVSLGLFAGRVPTIRSRSSFSGFSREVMLLANNIFLVVAVGIVLLGTLYPVAHEAITGGEKVSVGPPIFNWFFVPLMCFLACALSIAPVSRWKRTPLQFLKWAVLTAMGSIFLGILLPLLFGGNLHIGVILALALGLWIVSSQVAEYLKHPGPRTLGYWGMFIAHSGFAMAIVGVAVTSILSHSVDVRMSPGDSVELNGQTYVLKEVNDIRGPNYRGYRGVFEVGDFEILPEKRAYLTRDTVMTEAGIKPGFTRDLVISMGERLPDTSWSLRIQDKPLVRWVWLGALLMAVGGMVAIFDVRYRRLARRESRYMPLESTAV